VSDLPQIVAAVPLNERWHVYAPVNGKLELAHAAGLFAAKYGREAEKACRDEKGEWWLGPLKEGER